MVNSNVKNAVLDGTLTTLWIGVLTFAFFAVPSVVSYLNPAAFGVDAGTVTLILDGAVVFLASVVLTKEAYAEFLKRIGKQPSTMGDGPDTPSWLTLKEYKGYMTAFVDVDAWRSQGCKAVLGTKPLDGNYYDIVASASGYGSWEETTAWVVKSGGGYVVCSAYSTDPFADNTVSPTSRNDILLEMEKKATGAEMILYLLEQLRLRGVNIAEIKAGLCMTPKQIEEYKNQGLWGGFLADTNPIPLDRLSLHWENFLKNMDDDILKRMAFSTYYAYTSFL